MYFDRWGSVVKINGVKLGSDLDFRGPFPLNALNGQEVYAKLKAANRLTTVTLAGLKDHAKKFAWVLPGTPQINPNGHVVKKKNKKISVGVWGREFPGKSVFKMK